MQRMNSIVSWCFIASVSLGLEAKDEAIAETESPGGNAVSLELFEYLAEFSERDGTLIDPQTFESITPKAQVQCETQTPKHAESLKHKAPLNQTEPDITQDPIMAALCLRSGEGTKSQNMSDKLKPEDDA